MLYQIGKFSVFLSLITFVSVSPVLGGDCTAVYGNGETTVTLATGSPGELGLLEALAKAFCTENNAKICWKKAGTGEAFKLLKEKQADLIMVHDPKGEKDAVTNGWAIKRTLIGSNEFYIVGPADDPAQIAKAKTASEAYSRIADAKATFFSRGDNSGTHKKETDIWKKAGIQPAGDWYIVTKEFMMATLKKAHDMQGYFMTDSSTWVEGKKDLPKLKILFQGDPVLINTYHALCQPQGASPSQPLAAKFVEFAGTEKGQQIIRNFGKERFGEAIYNDAEYARKYVE